MNEIIVDDEGYKQYFEILESLKKQSLENSALGSEAYKDAVGDGWHDNFAFEEAMRESRTLAAKINNMILEERKLKIIKKENLDFDKINIGDIFEVEIRYSKDDIEKEKLKLTGKYQPNTQAQIKEISLNSPIGKAVYKKIIGSETSYKVNGKTINIKLLNKY